MKNLKASFKLKPVFTNAAYAALKEKAIALYEDLVECKSVNRYDALELAVDYAIPKTLEGCMKAAWVREQPKNINEQLGVAIKLYNQLQADVEEFMFDKVAQLRRRIDNNEIF